MTFGIHFLARCRSLCYWLALSRREIGGGDAVMAGLRLYARLAASAAVLCLAMPLQAQTTAAPATETAVPQQAEAVTPPQAQTAPPQAEAAAQPAASTEAERFKAWVRELRPAALEAGVSEAGFDRLFAGLTPDCAQTGVFCGTSSGDTPQPSWTERTGLPKSCDKVAQREFLEPAGYFPEDYLRRLVRKGQALLEDLRTNKPETWRHILMVEETYGVPVPILMGLWARETSLGDARLNYNGVVALASLAYAGQEHRRAWMRRQLIAALKMVDRGEVAFADFRSSWAGATGLTQIMPEEYLRYAVDADGDGRKDIWTSVPDALATTANVLKQQGWGAPGGWGRQVRVPAPSETFDCTQEGRVSRKPAARWTDQLGLTPVTGPQEAASPPFDPDQPAWLLMPAGTGGPAFLVTENFDVLRDYNPSDLYALFIGAINDRLACDTEEAPCGFAAPWPDRGEGAFAFSVENICRLQLGLKQRGMLHGEADGLFGPQTRTAIGRWQKAQGSAPSCYPTRAIYDEITGAVRAEAPHKDKDAATP
jgi:lytic murein transglycosylase